MEGEVIAITGSLSFPRSYYVQMIKEHGGTFSSRVTKKVTVLVTADPGKTSTKLDKARKNGVRVVSEEFFNQFIQKEEKEEEAKEETVSSSSPAHHPAAPDAAILMREGDVIRVSGNSSNYYEVRLRGGNYYCTCPAWRNAGGGPVRTCKHLKFVLGLPFDRWRLKYAPGAESNQEETEEEEEETEEQDYPPTKKKKTKGKGKAQVKKKFVKPSLILAEKWNEEKHDPTGWWISEKYDGLRAYWDGQRFLSRQGNLFFAPQYFTETFPKDVTLDGELYLGRKRFEETVSIVKTQNFTDERWSQLRFMVFDAPSIGDKPFESRVQFLKETLAGHKFATVVKQVQARDKAHVINTRDRSVKKGAEGLMLRKPESVYVGKRTKDLLKVKVWYDDEAEVVDHVPGKGRNKGRIGALACRSLKSGKEFNVGTGFSDKQRENPPAIGSLITFKYQELTKAGIPRFPVFLKEAEDHHYDQEETAEN